MIHLKRAYEKPETRDGERVLVERLWPRGVRKDDLQLDEWLKTLAPSDALRRWFHQDPDRWNEFVRRYRKELEKQEATSVLQTLAARASRGTITLIYSARDEEHNSAIVLRAALEETLPISSR